MASFFNENKVVILDLETSEQKEIEIGRPGDCASSQHYLAVTTSQQGVHLFSMDGVLVHIVPDSTEARCVAFHPRNTNILAVGCKDGSVRMWDLSTLSYVSSFKEHTDLISSIRFAPDCRLFLSSFDNTASIVTFDNRIQILSSLKLEGHTDCVNDILPLPSSNECVTGSDDKTIKVWDSVTGECIRTLTECTRYVVSLAVHSNGHYFASGSRDRTVVIWSSETFKVLHGINFPSLVQSLVFGESEMLYVGVYGRGVMSCNALTGEVGAVIMRGTGFIRGVSLGKMP